MICLECLAKAYVTGILFAAFIMAVDGTFYYEIESCRGKKILSRSVLESLSVLFGEMILSWLTVLTLGIEFFTIEDDEEENQEKVSEAKRVMLSIFSRRKTEIEAWIDKKNDIDKSPFELTTQENLVAEKELIESFIQDLLQQ